jgi:RNA polymerase sigma-70 factor (ECF subfamily)
VTEILTSSLFSAMQFAAAPQWKRDNVLPRASIETVGVKPTSEIAVDESERRRLFNEVFLPHLAQAFRLARWLAGNNADAEDIVQEASLRAYRGIHGFGGINARAWTLTITRNTAYSWLLKNRPAAVVFTEDLDHDEKARLENPQENDHETSTPETVLLSRTDTETVRAAIDALPPPFKEVIVLREMQDLSYREIAEIIGAPVGTIMSRLSRAREILSQAIRSSI